MLGGLGWAGPTNWAGLSPKKRGGRSRPIRDLGQSRPNKVFYFRLGQTWPRQPGWARVSLAHEHIRNGPEPAWPSERNPSMLGQNRPGPALENQPVGGIIFPPSSCMQNERSACRRKTQKTKRNKGGRKVYLMRRRRCPAG
jgi:hypothetical protein